MIGTFLLRQERAQTLDAQQATDSRHPNDALFIALVWAAYAGFAFFVVPRHYDISTAEIWYYTVYNVAAGAAVGLHMFDRRPGDGLIGFALRGSALLLAGTLANEAIVEPFVFAREPINGEGLYYGLTEAIWTTAVFLLFRVSQRLRAFERRPASRAPAEPSPADRSYLFLRVSGGTRRLHAQDVLYMAAERDFTRVVCANGEHFVSENLKSLVTKSAAFGFVRVHKSFAVNIARVERFSRKGIQIAETRVPVGRRYYQAVASIWGCR